VAVVAIYDSGVGGLSIYQNVVARCPEHDYLFVSDSEQFPYGSKPEDELVARVKAVVTRLDQDYCIDVLIMACNTASTLVLPYLREMFEFQVIGVVPAIKPAAELSKTKRIGLLATPATIARPYTDRLIAEFASDCHVVKVGSSELVLLAEHKLIARPLDESVIGTILKPIIDDAEIDVIVLACTHFPLLKVEIASQLKKYNRHPRLVDSGEAIANRLVSISQALALEPSASATRVAIMTDNSAQPSFVAQLKRMGFSKLQQLMI
jgi:glutamate racemase